MKFPSQLGATVAFVVVATTTTKTVSGNLASPFPFEETNADGTPTGEMYIHGGPGESWFEDKQGFTICPVDEQPTRRSRRFLGVLDWFTGGTSEEDLASSDPERTFYYCDQDENGNAVPRTDLKVGESDPQASGLPAHIEITSDQLEAQCGPYCQLDENGRRLGEEEIDGSHRKLQGTLKNLVVLMRFSDHATRDLPSVGDVDDLMSADSPTTSCPTGSVKQVFLENSNGRLILDSTVYQWVTLDPLYTETYCANGRSGLDARVHECIANALDQVEAGGLDFRDFDQDSDGRIDAITFLHSGYGAEWNGAPNRIWSHKWVLYSINDGGGSGWTSNTGVSVYTYHISPSLWGTSGNAIGRIGVIAHETGHFLGLPDLYDTDGGGQGLNSWSLMANSWGFDGSQLYPPLMDPWCKIQLGWVTPTVLTETSRNIEIKPSYTEDDYYVIQKGFPQGEYLVIENRRRVGYDSQIPREGLMIYHIDDSASFNREGFPGQFNWPQNGNHYRVALLQADGAYNLERGRGGDSGDVFHGGSGGVSSLGPGPNVYPNTDSYKFGNIVQTRVTIENISPAGEMMTFDFLDGDDAVEGAPTQAPTTEGPHEISVRVTHDRYPEETSWNLVNVAGGGVLARQNAGEVTTDNTVVVETIRVYPGTFRFDISDVYNDGICCTYGIGSFEIKVDGMVVYASDGSFGQSDSTTFEVGGAIIDTSAPTGQSSPAPTPIPTVQPTGPPTVFPTVSPSTSPTFPAPTAPPTVTPTDRPTTLAPTNAPTSQPSNTPTTIPTSLPTVSFSTASPTWAPTDTPITLSPTLTPTSPPSNTSTSVTTFSPTSLISTASPTAIPSNRLATQSPTVAPTKQPSAYPSTAPTVTATNLPTGEESNIDNNYLIEIEVVHDDYPWETSWTLTKPDGVNEVLASQAQGSIVTKGYITNIALNLSSGAYLFELRDSASDGICCGWGIGGYEVKVDGTVVATGGEYGPSKLETIIVGPVDPPSDDLVEVTVRVKHDNYPGETGWEMLDTTTNAVLINQVQGTVTSRGQVVTKSVLVSPGEYAFRITDTFSDGVCCSYGEGLYEVLVGNTVVASGGDFGAESFETFTVLGSIVNTPSPTGNSNWVPTLRPTGRPSSSPTTFPTKAPTIAPTDTPTVAPTKQPSAYPSAAPTGEESNIDNNYLIEIEVVHDDYPWETSWTLTKPDGVNEVLASQAQGSIVTKGYVTNIALNLSSGAYLFELRDSASDGICCGWGIGGYEVKVDGTVVATGGEYGPSKLETIIVGPVDPPSDDLVEVTVRVKHDNYPGETGWEMLDTTTNAVLINQVQGTVTSRGQVVTKSVLVSPGEYAFRITDTFSDGVCCSYGEGLYEVLVGNTVVASGGDFGAESFNTFVVVGL